MFGGKKMFEAPNPSAGIVSLLVGGIAIASVTSGSLGWETVHWWIKTLTVSGAFVVTYIITDYITSK
jgi:hypothetical protein